MKMKNSLNVKIWKYLMIYSILILSFLWLFQVIFLNKYYEYVKTNEIKQVASEIKKSKNNNDLTEIIDNLAYDKSVCVEIVNSDGENIYSSDIMSKGCFGGKDIHSSLDYKNDFILSSTLNQTYELINPRFNNKTLIYAVKLNNATYAFINTSIEPIDSTVMILKNQLLYVTLLVLILSFAIAYFISKHISKPIIKINKAAKKLAKGQFNIVFESDENIKELNELADTLNYTRDELLKTEEYRRDLMANISHDLKTPLTMIKAYAEMAKDLNSDNKEKRDNDMTVIMEEVDRLTILVNDILTLSKMQSEIEELNLSEFDLIKLIMTILNRYTIYEETENYQFKFNHQDEKLIVNADKKKLEQVIYNLINNAINYTGKDNLVEINIKNNKESILVEIKDTGKGINKEDIPYIWDKYYKNKQKHKRNLIGTGLGLSIVKNILTLHKYNYGVKSIKDKGSTFYFEIPKKETTK